MSENQPNRDAPPPLPTDDPTPDSEGAAALKKATEADLAPTPATAPFLARIVAFLMDWVLACIVFAAVLRWVIFPFYIAEISALTHWWNETLTAYNALFAQAQAGHLKGAANSWAEANAFSNNAFAKFPTDANTTNFISRLGLFQMLYFGIFFFLTEYLGKGASLGKRVFHLRVASTDDMGAPSFLDTLLRSALKSVFFCSPNFPMFVIGLINAHVPLFNPLRRAWHDRLSRTIVVDANTSPLPDEEPEDN